MGGRGKETLGASPAAQPSRAQTLAWLAILGLACIVRLGFAYTWHAQTTAEQPFRFGDSHSYWTLAEQIARGEAYQYGSENAQIFRAPVVPLLLAPFTLCEDRLQAIWYARVFFCLLSTLAVALLMFAATRIGGTCAGWACGCLAAVYPSAIGMSCLILSEGVFLPLMAGTLLSWQLAWEQQDQRMEWRWAALGGACAGLAILTRPSWLLFLPFLLAAGLLCGPQRWRHLRLGIIGLLACSIVMAPWWWRNARITGRFVPTTLQVGPSLLDSLGPGADGTSNQDMAFMREVLEEQLAADAAAQTPPVSTLEYRLNRRAAGKAIAWAREHPAEAFRLAGIKLKRTWSLWPDGGEVGSATIKLGITLGCVAVLALVAIGFLLAKLPRGWQTGVWLLPCIYFTLLHMVFVGSIRYREPAIFALTTVAGCGLAWLAGCPVRWKSTSPLTLLQGRTTGNAPSPEHAQRTQSSDG